MQPTLEHELVDGGRTVHGSREPEALIDRLHDLGRTPGGVKTRFELMAEETEQAFEQVTVQRNGGRWWETAGDVSRASLAT